MQTKLQNETPVVFKKILLVLLQIRVVVNVDVNFVRLLSPIRVLFCSVHRKVSGCGTIDEHETASATEPEILY
jgi:hypothetical protein